MQSSITGSGSNENSSESDDSSYSSDGFEQEIKIDDQNISESSRANFIKV